MVFRISKFVPLFFVGLLIAIISCREPASSGVPRLIKELKSKDAHQRNLAAQELSRYGTEAKEAVRPLINALWDDNLGVRSAAAYALNKIGTEEAKKAVADYKREKEKLNR